MPQKKRLNGLPYDLIKSYFATDKYCVCGYMADWMLNTARRLNVDEITIDIINQTHIPSELNFHPFTYELPFLKAIIERTLTHNGFDKDFIIEAKITVEFLKESKELTCHAWLVDRESNKYSVGPLTELSYCEEFNPFDLKDKTKIEH
jgi:hypothetical protein